MSKLTLWYSVSNGGDGSAYPQFFETERLTEMDQELMEEGWGECCNGSIEIIAQLLENKEVKDYDILVPSREKYQIICKMLFGLADQAIINTFGGMKYIFSNGLNIDIWPEELDHFLKNGNKLQYFYNMKKNIMLKNYNE